MATRKMEEKGAGTSGFNAFPSSALADEKLPTERQPSVNHESNRHLNTKSSSKATNIFLMATVWFLLAVSILGMVIAWANIYHYNGSWNMTRNWVYHIEVPIEERATAARREAFSLQKFTIGQPVTSDGPVERLDNHVEVVLKEHKGFLKRTIKEGRNTKDVRDVIRRGLFLGVPGHLGEFPQFINLYGEYISRYPADFYMLDLLGQPSALHAPFVRSQARFLYKSIKEIKRRQESTRDIVLSSFDDTLFNTENSAEDSDSSTGDSSSLKSGANQIPHMADKVTLIAHSMGFIVIRHMYYLYPDVADCVAQVFCLSCVIGYHPLTFFNTEMAGLIERELTPLENLKVYGISSGARDELLSEEHCCLDSNKILPLPAVKNVHAMQTHISVMFNRPTLNRVAGSSWPQLYRSSGPGKKRISSGSSSEAGAAGSPSSSTKAILSTKDDPFLDAVESLKSPFTRINSLFTEVSHVHQILNKTDYNVITLPQAEGKTLLNLRGMVEHYGNGGSKSNERNSKSKSKKAKPNLYLWESVSDEPFALFLTEPLQRAVKHALTGKDLTVPGGESPDFYDPNDVVDCHGRISIYSKYLDSHNEMAESWSKIMPTGSFSWPQKVCVYLVSKPVIQAVSEKKKKFKMREGVKGTREIAIIVPEQGDKTNFNLQGIAGHFQKQNTKSLRKVTLWDWIRSLFIGGGIRLETGAEMITWLALSKEYIDYELFPFDITVSEKLNDPILDSNTATINPMVGLAWNHYGDLVSVGEIGITEIDDFWTDNGVTRKSIRNLYGLLDSETDPRIWTPRFNGNKHCKSVGEPGILFANNDDHANSRSRRLGQTMQEVKMLTASEVEIQAEKAKEEAKQKARMNKKKRHPLENEFDQEERRLLDEGAEKLKDANGNLSSAAKKKLSQMIIDHRAQKETFSAKASELWHRLETESAKLYKSGKDLLDGLIKEGKLFDSELDGFIREDSEEEEQLLNEATAKSLDPQNKALQHQYSKRISRNTAFLALFNLKAAGSQTIVLKGNVLSMLKQVFRLNTPFMIAYIVGFLLYFLSRLPGFRPLDWSSIKSTRWFRNRESFFSIADILKEFVLPSFIFYLYMVNREEILNVGSGGVASGGSGGSSKSSSSYGSRSRKRSSSSDENDPLIAMFLSEETRSQIYGYLEKTGNIIATGMNLQTPPEFDSYHLLEREKNLAMLVCLIAMSGATAIGLFLIVSMLKDICTYICICIANLLFCRGFGKSKDEDSAMDDYENLLDDALDSDSSSEKNAALSISSSKTTRSCRVGSPGLRSPEDAILSRKNLLLPIAVGIINTVGLYVHPSSAYIFFFLQTFDILLLLQTLPYIGALVSSIWMAANGNDFGTNYLSIDGFNLSNLTNGFFVLGYIFLQQLWMRNYRQDLLLRQMSNTRNPMVRSDVFLYLLALVTPGLIRERVYRVDALLKPVFMVLVSAQFYLLFVPSNQKKNK